MRQILIDRARRRLRLRHGGAAQRVDPDEIPIATPEKEGGTITGCVEVINLRKPLFEAIAVEPKNWPVISQALGDQPLKPGPHKIQGLGGGSIPKNLHLKDSQGPSADCRVHSSDER